MTGTLGGQPAITAKMEEEVSKGVDGYYLLLGVLTDVCPDCSEEEEDKEEEEEEDEDDC